MASPEGVCLMLGRRLPKDVADIIFEFGFHPWLARPHNRWAQSGPGHLLRSEWCEVCGVPKDILSKRARELVEFDKYWERTMLSGLPSLPGWTAVISRHFSEWPCLGLVPGLPSHTRKLER
jgi:hypothetical protein